jgi:hypothetical protein
VGKLVGGCDLPVRAEARLGTVTLPLPPQRSPGAVGPRPPHPVPLDASACAAGSRRRRQGPGDPGLRHQLTVLRRQTPSQAGAGRSGPARSVSRALPRARWSCSWSTPTPRCAGTGGRSPTPGPTRTPARPAATDTHAQPLSSGRPPSTPAGPPAQPRPTPTPWRAGLRPRDPIEAAPPPARPATTTDHHHRPPPPTATTRRASLRHQAAGILAGDCSTSTRSGDRAGRCCSPIELDPDQSTWPAWPPPQRRLGPPSRPTTRRRPGRTSTDDKCACRSATPHQGCHTLDDRFRSQDAKVLRPPVQAPRPTPTPNAGWHGPATCLDWLLIVGEVTAAAAPGRRQAPPPASSPRALG